MEFTKIEEIELPAAFDAHVHLRDGEMSQLVTPTIRQGGVNQVYVMVGFDISFSILTKLCTSSMYRVRRGLCKEDLLKLKCRHHTRTYYRINRLGRHPRACWACSA
jgi:hypothetical protein